MREMLQFYIDGQWVDPVQANTLEIINPATEEVCGHISLGSAEDVNKAVAAANKAAPGFALTSREERIELLQSILDIFARRHDEVATVIMEEMGAPWPLAKYAQAASGSQHIAATIEVLKNYAFEESHGSTCREPTIVVNCVGPASQVDLLGVREHFRELGSLGD